MVAILLVVAGAGLTAPPAWWTADGLAALPPDQVLAVYRAASAGSLPAGELTGRVLPLESGRSARFRRSAARLVWQGKVVGADGISVINRFVGLPAVRGRLGSGTSWIDGRPTWLIDYRGTSWAYRNIRDEIREVAPGLFLGLMYDRSVSPPKLVMAFTIERQR